MSMPEHALRVGDDEVTCNTTQIMHPTHLQTPDVEQRCPEERLQKASLTKRREGDEQGLTLEDAGRGGQHAWHG